MNLVSLTQAVSGATSLLLTLSNLFFVGLFAFAYLRLKKLMLVMLAIASICFAYLNFLVLVETLFGLFHVRLFGPAIMRILFIVSIITSPIAIILWSIGMYAVVSLLLSSKSTPASS